VDLVSLDDERRLTFLGFLTFLDPPKAGVDRVIADLATAGIGLRMITGDNRLAAAQVAAAVGIDPGRLPTGAEIDRLDDRQLVFAAQEARVFAEVDPLHKERVIQRSAAVGRLSVTWATGSTTPARCTWRTSGSRSTPPWMWPRAPPPSCCWTRT
jgi:Mg2+-importing ATPase